VKPDTKSLHSLFHPLSIGSTLAFLVVTACAPASDTPSAAGTSAATDSAARAEHAAWVKQNYVKSETMVPMRDGGSLFTQIYMPRDSSAREYPVLFYRTPYSIPPYGPEAYREMLGPSPEFDRAGYIFVFQDVRGKFRSEGDFEVMRALADSAGLATGAVDESTDNYDTIEWVLANVGHHNGKVGQWGISYSGWQTVMGMVNAHPALVAASPQASPSDMFIGDDWHHNGAFRIMYAFSWLSGNARVRSGPSESRPERFDYGTPWGYDFFLEAGSAQDIDEKYFAGQVPAWRDFIEHPNYDDFWKRQAVLPHLGSIRPAILNVAGWFDTEDFYGPMSIYKTIERENPSIENTLVVGPWLHGGWRAMTGENLGCVDFGQATSHDFQRDVQFPFFEKHLRDTGGWAAPEATVFETGTNQWRSFAAWPPAGVEPRSLYLGADGTLSFTAPTANGAAAADSYVSDPSRPVPFSAEIRTTLGHLWKVEDQRFASTRPDVLVYQTEPLTEDLTVAGEIFASLFVSTTGTDSDWVVKLIDVYPGGAEPSRFCGVPMGGYQMHMAGEVMRGRFRNGFERPEAMVPGQITPIRMSLRDRFHTFRAGHRIMVHVQSSWFPAYDRNPQTFVDIYKAKPSDYRKATQTVYRSSTQPSRLELPVLRRQGQN